MTKRKKENGRYPFAFPGYDADRPTLMRRNDAALIMMEELQNANMSKNGEPSVTAAVTRIIEHMRYLSGT
jgi:hypothetical protein